MHWFTVDWWKYLFEDLEFKTNHGVSWYQKVWCRIKGHPHGIIYYNPGGFEPDSRCKDCGDDLG